jgi:hypothetical protein
MSERSSGFPLGFYKTPVDLSCIAQTRKAWYFCVECALQNHGAYPGELAQLFFSQTEELEMKAEH